MRGDKILQFQFVLQYFRIVLSRNSEALYVLYRIEVFFMDSGFPYLDDRQLGSKHRHPLVLEALL
jgi:hypothetical protein